VIFVQLWCLIKEAMRPPGIINPSKHKVKGASFIFSEKSAGKVNRPPFAIPESQRISKNTRHACAGRHPAS
jgi:hypothetical protein